MKSVIFNAEEVRATLEGKKTQFRMVIKPQPEERLKGYFYLPNETTGYCGSLFALKCHFGKIGDKIFVKESFSIDGISLQDVWYWADGNPEFGDWTKPKPPQHMKQEQSRLTLRIKDIGVERIGEISEEDAACEAGVFKSENYWHSTLHPTKGTYQCWTTAKEAFGKLWNKKHPKHSFESNCWVWKIEFEVIND
ncbi:MAG: hypothetical protein FJ368_07050 [Pelagibacterales bacterium]|nr:hypothetical protein [Pelagibacterales bacterium]